MRYAIAEVHGTARSNLLDDSAVGRRRLQSISGIEFKAPSRLTPPLVYPVWWVVLLLYLSRIAPELGEWRQSVFAEVTGLVNGSVSAMEGERMMNWRDR